MDLLNADTHSIDLLFRGRSRTIAAAAISTTSGVLVVDPGPATCRERLLSELASAGIEPADLHGLLLTHIHLDHAGATGTLVREYPHLRVFVHERGARHLIDPSKLLASATRLYGEEMDTLWGEFAAVPAACITALTGGEKLDFGDRQIDVAEFRGHASHHVGYFDRRTGICYAGDTAGIRTRDDLYVYPPTPPPDIDLERWIETVAIMRGWAPTGVFITHFGHKADAALHLDLLEEEIRFWRDFSGNLLRSGRTEAELEPVFIEGILRRIAARIGDEGAAQYAAAAPLSHCWWGLVRYWQKSEVAGR